MDGGHDHGRPGRHAGPGADHLGAEHVRVDQVDLVPSQVASQLADGGLVIGLLDDIHRQPEPIESLHRRTTRE